MKKTAWLVGLFAAAAYADPVIFWVSQPVRPGETVLAQGGGWGSNAVVEVSHDTTWTTAQVLQVTSRSLKFVLPKEWPMGAYSCRVNGGRPAPINAPEIWWVQGDRGRTATPGGWIRAFGTCLTTTNLYSLRLPVDLPPGNYSTNGISFTVAKPEPWPAKVFTGKLDDALAAAKANGGGIITLPAGTNELRRPIVIPPKTILRGAGREATVLLWSAIELPEGSKPVGLVSGTSFGLEGLTVAARVPHAGPGIARTTDPEGWAFIRRVRVALANEPKPGRHGIYIDRADNTEITGCVVEGVPRTIGLNKARYACITSNDLRYGWNGVTMNAAQAVIFEDNQLCVSYTGDKRDTGSNFTAYGAPVARDLYFARNRLWSPEHHDNGFTFDGGDGMYLGKVVKDSGTRVTLERPPMRRQGEKLAPFTDWIGASLHVMDGPGAGQYRHITGFHGNEVEVDRAWDVPLTSDSIVTLVNFIGRVLVVDNDFEDALWTKAYAMTADVIFAGNQMSHHTTNIGSLDADAGIHNIGLMPGFHFQALDNELVLGPTRIGCNGRHIANKRSARAGLNHEWYQGPVMLGSVFRGNRARPEAAKGSSVTIGSSHPGVSPVADVLIERNEVPTIRIEKNNHDILIRDNSATCDGPGLRDPSVRILPSPQETR